MHRLYSIMIRLHEGIFMVGSGKHGAQLTHSIDCNVFVLDGGGGEFALIDAGGGVEPERIVANMERIGIEPGQIRYLLLTHAHGDHAAGAAFFHERYGMQVIASKEAAPWIENADREKISLNAAVRAGVYPADYEFRACPVERQVSEYDEIVIGSTVLRVLDTPGHARGHIGFMMERGGRRLLFGGDSVFAGGKVVIQNIWDCSIQDYAATVAKLQQLRIDSLFPGHGVFLADEAWKHIDLAHGYFERLEIPPNL
ncbi:MBL fold metallo-hydrolase [Paenibacillus spongiae]|uniref:MBL fold metallo-hydrolase n=1 Tax=Paenibacillus spongiae TaxID=2909671 RepID=A0ABY5S4X1_9BACL|nr:MBL fold metallo-hydrolase [Paenibacillus spongiae]UVI28538.1 MBL fold metallo-hydrolase [Paenibacillus spongiae]